MFSGAGGGGGSRPGDDGGAEEMHGHAVAAGEGGGHGAVRDVDAGLWDGRGDGNGGGFVFAFHCGGFQGSGGVDLAFAGEMKVSVKEKE